jgi:hypothetical protein
MWEFIIPALISTVSGAIQSGSAARQTTLANQRNATAAQERRQMLMGLIDQIQNTDYRGMDRAASSSFSQAADQIEALTAGRGTFGSGETGARNLQTRALSDVLIALEGQKGADQLQRQQLVGNLMGDQAFGVPNPLLFNPQQAGMQAALGGGAAGLASAAGAYFGTDAGQNWLRGLGSSPTPAPVGEPIRAFGVRPAAVPGSGAQYAPMATTPTVRPVASGPFSVQAPAFQATPYSPLGSYVMPLPAFGNWVTP